MVKVVNWAFESQEGEQNVIDRMCVNTASYVGKQLKTDSHVPGCLRNNAYAYSYAKVFKADHETVVIIR